MKLHGVMNGIYGRGSGNVTAQFLLIRFRFASWLVCDVDGCAESTGE